VTGSKRISAPSSNDGIQKIPFASKRGRRGPESGVSYSVISSVFASMRPIRFAYSFAYQMLPSFGFTSMP